jgi:hypothetical protein
VIINGGVVTCTCGNAARYINERGELCCSLCPLKEGIDSIKLDDVPKLLAWARRLDERAETSLGVHAADVFDLRDIIQRAPVCGAPVGSNGAFDPRSYPSCAKSRGHQGRHLSERNLADGHE